MLDDKTKLMLEVANQLTAEDIELIKSTSRLVPNQEEVVKETAERETPVSCTTQSTPAPGEGISSATPRGEYERSRPRDSKVSTACLGNERAKHEWWPVGTELVGRIGNEQFTAEVVENQQLKSGRSIRVTSGAASGRVCNTPTRAALEATEAFRQANNLGRGGGVTNGWSFWKPIQN